MRPMNPSEEEFYKAYSNSHMWIGNESLKGKRVIVYSGRRKTPTIRRIVYSVSEEASVSERLNEQGKPL